MALVLTIRQGEVIYVGGKKLTFTHVYEDDWLEFSWGKERVEMRLDDDYLLSKGPNVWTTCVPGNCESQFRIIFDAPREVVIDREKLHRKKNKERKNNGK